MDTDCGTFRRIKTVEFVLGVCGVLTLVSDSVEQELATRRGSHKSRRAPAQLKIVGRKISVRANEIENL